MRLCLCWEGATVRPRTGLPEAPEFNAFFDIAGHMGRALHEEKDGDMALWQDAFHGWAQAWAAVQDLEAAVAGDVAAIGTRQVVRWTPGANTPLPDAGVELLLATDDPAAAADFAAANALHAGSRLILLSAQTEDLDLVPQLPPEANLAEAPMENYDLVEIALFDRPVARGRLAMDGDLGVLAGLSVDSGHDDLVPQLEQAMAAGLGEEAFIHGADTLYLVAGEEQAARFAAVEGWTRVAELLSFSR